MRFKVSVAMLFAAVALPMFFLCFSAGMPLAYDATDFYLHDTYYVIGHFHYALAPAIGFGTFAVAYYLFPKVSGRWLNPALGYWHFWLSLIFVSGLFFSGFLPGIVGVHRRWYDGGGSNGQNTGLLIHWNTFMSVSALLLVAAQFIFLVNVFWTLLKGREVRPAR